MPCHWLLHTLSVWQTISLSDQPKTLLVAWGLWDPNEIVILLLEPLTFQTPSKKARTWTCFGCVLVSEEQSAMFGLCWKYLYCIWGKEVLLHFLKSVVFSVCSCCLHLRVSAVSEAHKTTSYSFHCHHILLSTAETHYLGNSTSSKSWEYRRAFAHGTLFSTPSQTYVP